MSYNLGGSNGESTAFEKTIQNSAIEVLHESQGLVSMTNVVAPTQGNTYKVPSMAPISFGEYDESAGTGTGVGEQNAALSAKEISATPAVAQSGFGKFIGWSTAYDLASNIGSEMGMSFAEKVDQRVAGAFQGFKATVANTNHTVAYGDGFARASALGAQELIAAAGTIHANSSASTTAKTVVGLVRNVVNAWRKSRNPGRPVIVLGPDQADRLLAELTDPATNLSALGNELQSTGRVENLYGATLVFTTFLSTATRDVNIAGNATVSVGAAFGPQAVATVMNQGLNITMGDVDGGLKTWVTGLGYFGSGVASTARGMAINIA